MKDKWEKIGEHYYLKKEFCYPETTVEVRHSGYKKWIICISNKSEKVQAKQELARKPGSVVSRRTWKQPGIAKYEAAALAHNRGWLTSAGITFKEEKRNETV